MHVMRVFVVRHAIAHERDRKRWPDDSRRPLTAPGKRKFRKAARGLARILPGRVAILSSPWLRARETAAILAAARGGRCIECKELAGNQAPGAMFELLRLRPGMDQVIIGHEPALSRFVAAAIGAGETSIGFRKGGAACVEFRGRILPGRGKLLWHLPPKMLRAIR